MKLIGHIKEIKNRAILNFLTFITLLVTTTYYKKTLLYLTIKPGLSVYENKTFYFIFTNLMELFITYIKLNIFISFNITIITIICHLFFFLTPIFSYIEYDKIKQKVIQLLSLWILSFFINHNFVMPQSWKFFLSFQDTKSNFNFFFDLYFEAKISEYIDFFIESQILCYCASLIFFFLTIKIKMNTRDIETTKILRKKYYVCFFFVAAIVSPPEIAIHLLFSFFLCTFFEICIVKSIITKTYHQELICIPLDNQLKETKTDDVNNK